ncbi:diguanylate cyclase [Agarivorans sp. MS3-6]|uniref:diguanylate cyclase n=1 Tax=Agarivorans sp. TSD2052 TaxID=2937286 RepID=UPI00200BCA37|nr:diguanylate cyclase [Agarivorans sp. TSD2052]UPW17004.1 diguanylate cyclase [Agarivorans sp. TSD2052]
MHQSLLGRVEKKAFGVPSNDIKDALLAHRRWAHKISASLVLRQVLVDPEFTDKHAHHYCKFGRWLWQLSQDNLIQADAFGHLDHVHQGLHKSAARLLSSFAQNDLVSAKELEDFHLSQDDFVASVLDIFEFSLVNKYQFDTTTKLINRRTIDVVLANEKRRLEGLEDSCCCIVLADIDRFKDINDSYGHDVGDVVLEHTAAVLNGSIRRNDTVARFGGEEFLFVMPDMSLQEATQAVERIRIKLANSVITHLGKPLSVTASFGITQLCQNSDIKESIKRADVALYEAKRLGRNCTIVLCLKDLMQHLAQEPTGQLNAEETIQQYCRNVEQVLNQ